MCMGAPVFGVMIRFIVRACRIQTGRSRSSTDLPLAPTSEHRGVSAAARPRDLRAAIESAIGRLSLPAITAAPSAARKAARRQGRIAIMDFPAWVRPGAAVAALAVVALAVAAAVAAGVNWREL